MKKMKSVDVGQVWWFWFMTSAFTVDKQLRRLFRVLPRDPRCKFCNAPFQGIGGMAVRALFGKRPSNLNPNFCNLCDEAAREFPGGAEVEMAMLFADIRGSTVLSERMSPTEFSQLINRFYTGATRLIGEEDGMVEKLAGDSLAAFWGAGFAGSDYVRRTILVGLKLANLMTRQEIPVGIGVHTGIAFFGVVGASEGLTNITAVGDEVNLAARLGSIAAAGEILISEPALDAARVDSANLESRRLKLKGIHEPVDAWVMHAGETVAFR
jgi:adenylate cyclase